MPKIARFEMPDGRIARFEVPDDYTPEQAQAEMQQFASQPSEAEDTPPENRQPDSFADNAMDVIGELAATANRSVTEFIDFLGPDTVNSILSLAGSDKRVPTLTGALADTGIQGGFMEPGTAREVVRAAGATIPAAVSGIPVAGRNLASVKGAAGEILGAGSARQPAAIAGQELVRRGADSGIPVLTSDVRPPSTFPGRMVQQTAEKIPLVGTAPVRQGQQQMRQEAVERVASKYGDFSYDAIVNSLKAKKDRIKNAAGSTLERVGSRLDEVGTLTTTNTRRAIRAAQEELSKPNVIRSSSANDDLQVLLEALDQPQTFTSLKENRTAFREIVNSADPAKRSQLTSRAKSLLTNVEQGMRRDMDAFAKNHLSDTEYRQWQRANSVYADQARTLTRSRLKNVLDKGDIQPESVKTMLFSQKPSEQKLLYNSLTNEGRENARAAIISKVVEDAGKLKDGVTPNSFASRMRKYQGQVDTFFKGEEKQQLEGLVRVLDATRRAQDAAVTTPTGQQLIGGLSIAGLYLDPASAITGATTVGGLARLYESAPVRNALLKLGSLPKSSNRYAESLLAAQYAIFAAANADRDQSADKQ